MAFSHGTLAVKRGVGDFSKRLCLPLDMIAPEDAWLGEILHLWRSVRPGWLLPARSALDPVRLLRTALGRAHIIDTQNEDPESYRFRLWGTVNSYGGEYTNCRLGQMPAGLMRDDAVEDYWEVVTGGVPTYQLVYRGEHYLRYSYARLLLPLATDGRRVDQLLVLINERRLPELEAAN
ncbi:MAG: PAS domain-containing protein [Alphaproteobacteria bacterium]|nr:PAS domain-containing protein [Alphaproteobacteria bacterium]MBV9862471.1 PAS domain-containing protein [Alphaproteobacteria bacterium]